jgi:branched-chain amino acid transport system substrate-binding protein
MFLGGTERMKKTRSLALIMSAALFAAACGSSSKSSSSTASTPTVASSTSAAATTTPSTTGGSATAPSDTSAAVTTDGVTTTPTNLTVPDNADQGVKGDSINIGWMGDATGPTATSSGVQGKGVEAAVKYINDNGGVLGRKLTLSEKDVQFNADLAKTGYNSIVHDEKVLTLLDTGPSTDSLAVVPDIEKDGIPVLGPALTINQFLPVPNFYSLFPHYGNQADAMVASLDDRVDAPLKVVMFAAEVASAQEVIDNVKRATEAHNGTYVGDVTYNATTPNFADAVTKVIDLINSSGANAIVIHGGSSHGLGIITELVAQGIKLPIAGIAGLADPVMYTQGPPETAQLLESAHAFVPAVYDCSECKVIRDAVKGTDYEQYTKSPFFSFGWLEVMMTVQAMNRAATASGKLTWETMNTAIKAGPLDTGGLTCPVDFSKSNYSACAIMFKWDTDHLVPTKPVADWPALNTFVPTAG